ncbi:MAG TPA: hypothetical protein VFQ05_04725 [Candidatus Eisenbacteria bacterium]|nr:hypothetical protein [Candidatus Eisenbacteria bacterium]
MPHILIHDPRGPHEEWQKLLAARGRDVVVCCDRDSFVNALGERRPDVLVYVLTDLELDLQLLFELRRVASTLPIVLLDGPTDLEIRRRVQKLNPTYYGVSPTDSSEVSDVVRSTLGRVMDRMTPLS